MIPSLVANDVWFWINYLIPVSVALYMLLTESRYILKEFGIQMAVTTVIVVIAFSAAYRFGTDMYHVNYYGGKVVKFTFEEEWEEEYDCSYESCDSEGKNCVTIPQTCYTDHPEYYWLTTSNGETIGLSEKNFRVAEREFGSRETEMHRSGQTYTSKALGEGDIWKSYPSKIIPTAVGHTEPNYVRLQMDNVIHDTFTKEELASPLLKKFPEPTYNKYGRIHLQRVLVADAGVDWNYTNVMQERLGLMSANLGALKEINPMVYLVGTEDRSFKYLLEAFYKKGHKNDSILILGIEDGNVTWSDTIAWTEDESFITNNSSLYYGLTDPVKIMDIYEKQIIDHWDREPMKKKEYLAKNIDLNPWIYFWVFMFNGTVSFLLMFVLIHDRLPMFLERLLRRR